MSDPTSLNHHGDLEEIGGLLGFAVNVDDAPRPAWLNQALRDGLQRAGRYPDGHRAREAIAAHHGRPVEEVLLTNGAAEAFQLIALARSWRKPVVVHPQFTEPEAALLAAGRDVERVMLHADNGFRLVVDQVLDGADLVVIGNPTNPTGVLHPADAIEDLCCPGRVVVVDEAFMDAVPGERESLAGRRVGSLLAVRSLTKSLAIPGIRAGYVLGPAGLIADLARHQPAWSVNSLALAAAEAWTTPEAQTYARSRARERAADREQLADGLRRLGLDVFPSEAPFVLVRGQRGLREALREKGVAVRSGATFPGLSEAYARIAVRGQPAVDRLLAACADVLPALRDGEA